MLGICEMVSEVTCLIALTTFKKADAATVLQQSLIDHGYAENCEFFWGDDFNGEIIPELGYSAVDACSKFQAKCQIHMQYGPRGGVSINKNRCIKYFLEQSKAPYFLLLDDDLVFHQPGLIEELIELSKECRLDHITGMWIDPPSAERKLGIDGQYWEQSFKKHSVGDIKERITYHATWDSKMPGSHGNAGFFTRRIVEALGYYNIWSTYGYEHAGYTSRAMRLQGRTPMWHPQHHHAWKYYHGQHIPNRYEGTTEEIKKAEPEFWKTLALTYAGLDLIVKEHGLTDKEVLL